mmetsp:Transcript_16322/g.18804  ORF Transcript_16322/g.18804 Transcript_16322/m.18804 type:complete len:165 (+) Transcript_16322:160-654(+)
MTRLLKHFQIKRCNHNEISKLVMPGKSSFVSSSHYTLPDRSYASFTSTSSTVTSSCVDLPVMPMAFISPKNSIDYQNQNSITESKLRGCPLDLSVIANDEGNREEVYKRKDTCVPNSLCDVEIDDWGHYVDICTDRTQHTIHTPSHVIAPGTAQHRRVMFRRRC